MSGKKEKEWKHLSDLTPDKKNMRKHNPRNVGMIVRSLAEVGVSRSGVCDEAGNILAGNGTYDALSEAGIEKIKVVEADGNEWVVVKRVGLSEDQKVKLALYDNRTAELADWDVDNMGALLEDFPDAFNDLFSEDELADLLGNEAPGELEGEDDAPEPPEKSRTCLGDMYRLGEHILMCGDSTDKGQVDQLMGGEKADMVFTDPPYGLGGYKGRGQNTQKPVKNDEFDPDIFYKCIPEAPEMYVWGGFKNLRNISFEPRDVIVWRKNNFGMGRGYRGQYEVCFYLGGFSGSDSDVWDVKKDIEYKHPTQKPVCLPERAINNSKPRNVVDLFGGSGSTLIACQKLKRKCYMMELDPAYCDVIVTRFKTLFPDEEIHLKVAGNPRWHKREWGVDGALTL